jgi:hypothetical protein
LRVPSPLSISVEIDFINAGLLPGAWLGVPCTRMQLNFAELLNRKATPTAPCSRRSCQAAVATSSKLIAEHMELAFLPTQHMRTK